jgi:hypothetical protein
MVARISLYAHHMGRILLSLWVLFSYLCLAQSPQDGQQNQGNASNQEIVSSQSAVTQPGNQTRMRSTVTQSQFLCAAWVMSLWVVLRSGVRIVFSQSWMASCGMSIR